MIEVLFGEDGVGCWKHLAVTLFRLIDNKLELVLVGTSLHHPNTGIIKKKQFLYILFMLKVRQRNKS